MRIEDAVINSNNAYYIGTFIKDSIEKIFKSKFSTATDIQLLWKGHESFEKIFHSINEAKKLICLEFYIFRNDETGNALAELLKKKAKEGVKIYVLYDHFGSFGTPRSFWRNMQSCGIKVRASKPFIWQRPFHYIHRDHKKMIVIDSEKAFTGGLNIANEYSGIHFKLKGKAWRDTGIMVEGAIAKDLFNIFKKTWYLWGGEKIPEIAEETTDIIRSKKTIPVIPIFVSNAKQRRGMRGLLYYSINHAKKSIFLTTAYFTPSKRMVETLENAVERGVQVKLLVPGISDVPAASYAGRAFFERLLKAGIDIYLYTGEILHAKTYVFDECWSIVGSTNLDFQSLRYNDEGNIGILDREYARRLIEIFEEDIKNSIKIELSEWVKRPCKEKILESFFSIFRKRL
jgi:cardiolipin synthase